MHIPRNERSKLDAKAKYSTHGNDSTHEGHKGEKSVGDILIELYNELPAQTVRRCESGKCESSGIRTWNLG